MKTPLPSNPRAAPSMQAKTMVIGVLPGAALVPFFSNSHREPIAIGNQSRCYEEIKKPGETRLQLDNQRSNPMFNTARQSRAVFPASLGTNRPADWFPKRNTS